MARTPSFQFYPADWFGNAKLRRCSDAARGAWIDVLCILHDADEYGIVRWPLGDLARAAGVRPRLLKELLEKGVLKGTDGAFDGYEFRPRHSGKDGEPVQLIDKCTGPVWFCSRFVRDEYIRKKRGQSTQFTSENQPPKAKPKGGIGTREGDGPSSASSTSSSTQDGRSQGEKKKRKEKGDFSFPSSLDTEAFRTAWAEFMEYRREKKKSRFARATLVLKFAEFAAWGEAKAIQAIRNTIANGWDGVFEPKGEVPAVAGKIGTYGPDGNFICGDGLDDLSARIKREQRTNPAAFGIVGGAA